MIGPSLRFRGGISKCVVRVPGVLTQYDCAGACDKHNNATRVHAPWSASVCVPDLMMPSQAHVIPSKNACGMDLGLGKSSPLIPVGVCSGWGHSPQHIISGRTLCSTATVSNPRGVIELLPGEGGGTRGV